ncbi:MAG: PepSY domain-containing protein [Gemmatimonadetes bacterium]|nr:PepSY domain-containing protein [Gemmatimonadota bacterium]MBP6670730.1 PepSY domain-containing protein [Gemmatimonadales bacterium]MBK6779688.1 PepSY domain-containing protein [Gemmatimonadota bacterium]MBK7350412.1 PepSY domain-containing protein [Gemmatimonadota bacterium]MBK7716335.1 PepSY domain-containing protein [Gemmatimonadota bacterium]
MLRLFYKVHKWVGIGIGLFLLMWIVTGMLLGGGEGRPRDGAAPDYSRAVVSPADAQALAASGDSALREIRAVELDRIGSHLLYRVRGTGGTVLVDAEQPQRLEVTEALAREVATGMFPQGSIEGVELLTRHDRGYPNGALPAYRVRFADRAETLVHLSVRDGMLAVSNKDLRLNGTLHGLHTFASLRALGLARVPIRRLLIVASLISLVVVVTGYYMSLPRRWTRG